MKNLKYILILLIGISCKDSLDQVNPNRTAPDNYYKTPEQAVAAVDAVYNGFVVDGAYNRMTPVINDGRSDELICRSPWDALSTLSNFNLRATYDVNAFAWNAYYQINYRANQVLENVSPMELDEDLKNRILGQAHFLRALAYFNLTLMYDEVPLILETPKSEAEFYAPTAERAAIWNQIISDFSAAKTLLPVTYADVNGPDKGQKGRATRGAATAMLGKVYLYQERYQDAADEFEEVMDLNQYQLAANYKDNFTDNPSVEINNPETIFSIEFTTSNAPALNWGGDPNANWRQFTAVSPTYGAPGKGFFDFFPSNWLYNEMRQERTVDNKLDPRYHATILSYEPDEGYTTAYNQAWPYLPTDYFIKKQTNADLGKPDEYAFTSGINYNIIRLADVYLMYAECMNELDNRATAAEYIQKVRTRANLPDREEEFAGFDKEELREQLAHERVMELALEGSRFYDIVRWGWLEDAAKLEMLEAHDPEFANYLPGREFLKIPQGELDLNPNLKPNSANE
jgi:starch-binding outer membrane protein, SusD/RagB family